MTKVNEEDWILSPAYDLTYSNSLGGEHATTIHGNGVDPDIEDILEVANGIGLGRQKAEKQARQIRDCVKEELKEYIFRNKGV